MKCPHCTLSIHAAEQIVHREKDADGWWQIWQQRCPSCNRLILTLRNVTGEHAASAEISSCFFRPKVSNRSPVPGEVPNEFASDYREACLVLGDSPKASAALSRRCLQHILREKANVKKGNLFGEIQEALDSKKLPSHIVDSLDAVRHIGNFAAHPIKSERSGEIIEVELGEAEWNLDVLESLFDFYFVGPAKTKAKRDALNQKLAEAGKQPMNG